MGASWAEFSAATARMKKANHATLGCREQSIT